MNLGRADLRSLATFRIGLALVVAIDLMDRARDLTAHYTDAGVLPRAWFQGTLSSAYAWAGATGAVAALFVLTAVAIAMLAVGYRTRIATIALFALTVSLHERNPFVLHAGDYLLRLTLLWSMFLPLGALASLDARRRSGFVRENPERGPHIAAFQLQVVFLYVFAALQKTGNDWQDGTAVYYALNLGMLARPVAAWILQFPALFAPLTYGTLALEALGPFALIAPAKMWRVRMLAILAFLALHLGFAASMDLGIFPLVAAAGLLPFIPSQFWDVFPLTASRPVPTTGAPPTWTEQLARYLPAPLIAMVLAYNIVGLPWAHMPCPQWFDRTVAALRLEQRWAMFAPEVVRHDGWVVAAATLADSSVIDVFAPQEPINFARPAALGATLPSQRWRRYMMNLTKDRGLTALPYFHDYACVRASQAASTAATRIALHYLVTMTPPPGAARQATEHRILRDEPCETPTEPAR